MIEDGLEGLLTALEVPWGNSEEGSRILASQEFADYADISTYNQVSDVISFSPMSVDSRLVLDLVLILVLVLGLDR